MSISAAFECYSFSLIPKKYVISKNILYSFKNQETPKYAKTKNKNVVISRVTAGLCVKQRDGSDSSRVTSHNNSSFQ